MSFETWPTQSNGIYDISYAAMLQKTFIDGYIDCSGSLYNRLGNVIIGDSSNPDFDPSSNGITLNTTRICLGKDSSVTGDNGVAIGPDASANGLNSIALGYNSGTGSYTNSIALGANSTVGANNVISLGDGTQKVGIGVTTPTEALDVNGNIGLVGSGPKYIRGATDIVSLESEYALKIKSDWNDNNSSLPADIIFYTGASERMRIGRQTGYVGIGTTSPDNKLTIAGGAIQLNPYATGSKKFAMYSEGDKLHINPRTAAGGYDNTVGLIMNSSGYVGIGTTNPVHYFELGNVTTVYHTYNGYAHNTSNATSLEFNNVNNAHIVNAYIQRLGTQYVFFLSDRRLKKDIVDIHDDEALVDLRKLQPRKYKYIDQFTRTSNEVYGFIAQEVGEVLPNAINLDTQTIPNVYEIGHVSENIITLSNKTTIDLSLNKIIRLITETKDVNTKIVEIIDDKQFKVEETFETSDIFIYGTQEDDVNIIDKNAIFTVATAALQEVDRQQQADKLKIATLESKVATLETQITDLLARVTALENP